MNEHTSHGGNSARTLLWVVLALAAAALAYVTVFLAIPNNPLYSDRDAHGVSKYQFIEQCQDVVASAPEIQNLRSSLVESGQIQPGQDLHTSVALPSRDFVRGVQVLPQASWAVVTPVYVTPEGQDAPIMQIMARCTYDKAAGQTVAELRGS
ncbi:hypothetical protein ACFP81_05930 [Deinococcus lacus]|uniref:Uncharacterized protein n=1 Tax=Deinococcus lacus TaxID=392561 RepID=A0ABW1YBK3_9DEIO